MYDVIVDDEYSNRVTTGTDHEVVVSTRFGSRVTAYDPHGIAIALGCRSAAAASANNLAIVVGEHSIARGEMGAWLVFVEQTGSDLQVVPIYIDDVVYLADTDYALVQGKVVNAHNIARAVSLLQSHFASVYPTNCPYWDTLIVAYKGKFCTLRVGESDICVQYEDNSITLDNDQLETVYLLVDMLIG